MENLKVVQIAEDSQQFLQSKTSILVTPVYCVPLAQALSGKDMFIQTRFAQTKFQQSFPLSKNSCCR